MQYTVSDNVRKTGIRKMMDVSLVDRGGRELKSQSCVVTDVRTIHLLARLFGGDD